MRIPFLVAAVFVFFALLMPPAMAQGMIVSKFNCSTPLPCDGADPAFPSSEQIAALGNSCIVQNTGISPKEFFDPIAGIDNSGCLVQTGNPSGNGGMHCCIKARDENHCFMHCDLMAQ